MFQEDPDEEDNNSSSWTTLLEKWPFWLADLVCLIAAIAIYRSQLATPSLPGLIISAFLVVLGALFFCFPYIFEYLSKLRSESFERKAAIAEFTESQLAQTDRMDAQIRRLESILKRAEADLQVAEKFSEKMEVIGEALADSSKIAEKQAGELNALAGQMSGELAERKDLTQRITRRLDEWVGATDSIDALRVELIGLDRRVIENELLAGRFNDINAKLDRLHTLITPSGNESRARGSSRSEGGSLIKRALARNESTPGNPAVSRIIQGTSETASKTEIPSPETEAAIGEDTLVGEDPPVAAVAVEEETQPTEETSPETEVDAETLPENLDEAEASPDTAGEEPPDETAAPEDSDDAGEPDRKEHPERSTPSDESVDLSDEAGSGNGGDEEEPLAPPILPPAPPTLFAELPPPPGPNKAGKAKAGETAVLARVFIGIGNKPYLRGDLPGLSWDKGVPMDFREVGLWQWTTTTAEQRGTVRIYRNDQEPEKAVSHRINPTEHLEIRPRFP